MFLSCSAMWPYDKEEEESYVSVQVKFRWVKKGRSDHQSQWLFPEINLMTHKLMTHDDSQPCYWIAWSSEALQAPWCGHPTILENTTLLPEFDRGDVLIYEEVARMPPFQRKTLCVVGAQGVGRRTLKHRLVKADPTRFGSVIPRKYFHCGSSSLWQFAWLWLNVLLKCYFMKWLKC